MVAVVGSCNNHIVNRLLRVQAHGAYFTKCFLLDGKSGGSTLAHVMLKS
jgi:hypothetical protein